MPIKPELRQFYGKVWRTVTRPRILARAGNKCEQCHVPNHAGPEDKRIRIGGAWLDEVIEFGQEIRARWIDAAGCEIIKGQPKGKKRVVKIVLTIAHLNHTAGDDRDENLKALCQWCHLNYDMAHHAETRAARKDAARPLLQELIA